MGSKKIFITGANGFIGQHLVNFLADNGCEVWAMLRKGSIPGFDLQKNVKVVVADLLDKKSLEEGIPKASVVINLAANPYDPVLSFKVNVEGTQNLVVACKKNKVEKLIHISSQATKITNKGVYAMSKSQSDVVVRESGLRYVILKPSLVYGEGEKGLFNKIKMLVSGLPLIPVFGNGETKVNPIYVKDFCKLVELIIQNQKDSGNVYDVGSLESVTYNDVYVKIINALDKKTRILHVPVWVGLLGGKVFEILKMKSPPFFVDNVLGSTQETNCDPRLVMEKYGYKPINFNDGVKEVFLKEKVKLAVVGLGKMGLLHLSILSTFEDVEIVALIDNNPKLFKTIKSMGVSGRFYLNFKEAVKKEKIDAVYVLTPTFTHLEYIRKAIKNKISVFVEKPVALDEEEIKKIEAIAKNFDGVVSVGYTLLHKRVFRTIKEIIRSGEYGKVKSFKASYKHGEVLAAKKGWMFDKRRSGGGVMMNPGPHLFSVINWLFGQPSKIDGGLRRLYSVDVDDEASLTLDYKGFRGEVFLSWSIRGQLVAKTNLVVELEKAVLTTDGKQLKIESGGEEKVIEERNMRSWLAGPLFNVNPVANGEAYFVEDRMFVNAVKGGDKILSDLKTALATEKIIHNVYKLTAKND